MWSNFPSAKNFHWYGKLSHYRAILDVVSALTETDVEYQMLKELEKSSGEV
jgi:hypothetical protein